jgi:hypothetical protein
MDITEVVLTQHHQQRRMFALLDEIDRNDAESLTAVWRRLAVLLEVHAEAEETYFYPRLLELGRGTDSDGPGAETEDAIKDHNDIRDAIARAARHAVGSAEWWQAVEAAREANSQHMAEEERDDLADFRRHADVQTRHDIAVQFLVYEAQHAHGVPLHDKDPQDYVSSQT